MEALIAKLRVVFADDLVDVGEVTAILESYCSNRADWKQYALYDPHMYTRNLVDIGNDKYNMMVLCWPAGLGSNIHDHTDSHCFVKVLSGTLRETRFAWPKSENEPMKEIDCTDSKANEVCYMSATGFEGKKPTSEAFPILADELGLHRVENPSHVENAVSLHLYVPPYSKCMTFDQRTGVRTTLPVTFHTKYGRKVDYRGCKEGKLAPPPDGAAAATFDAAEIFGECTKSVTKPR